MMSTYWESISLSLSNNLSGKGAAHSQRVSEAHALGAEARQLARSDKAEKLREQIIEVIKRMQPALYAAEPNVRLDDSEVLVLFQAACDGLSGQDCRRAHNYLVRGLARGCRERGWILNVPPLKLHVDTEPSSVTSKSQERCQQFNELERLHHEELKDANKQEALIKDILLCAGQLLFSFIMFSGCLNRRGVDMLPEAIRSGVHVHDGECWLEFREISGATGAESKLLRRIFPAPITAMLLFGFLKTHGSQWPSLDAGQLLDLYLNYLGAPFSHGKKPHHRLIEISQAKATSYLSGVLRSHAELNNVSPPIDTVNMLRFITSKNWESATTDDKKINNNHRFDGQELLKKKGTLEDLEKSRRQLLKALQSSGAGGKQEKLRAKKRLEACLDASPQPHPIIEYCIRWALSLIEYGNVQSAVRLSTIRAYVGTVSNALMPLAPVRLTEPEEQDGEQWEALYQEAVENSPGDKRRVASCLRYFHSFLERAYDFPEAEIEGAEHSDNVDASVITPHEYLQAYKALIGDGKSLNARLCVAALILGYRCGLRRNETLGLQLRDFIDIEDGIERVELLIQRNGLRGLKSSNATRRLPLWLLLTKPEFEFIRATFEQRLSQCGGKVKNPFFDLPESSKRVEVERLVMSPISRALRWSTGDAAARFHQLRHSFASITFLRLLEFEPLELIPSPYRTERREEFFPWAHDVFWSKAGLTDTLFSVSLLSMWLGHASPSISLQVYIHLAEWVLFQRASCVSDMEIPQSLQANLTGMSLGAVEKHNQRHKLKKPRASQVVQSIGSLWPRTHRHLVLAKRREAPLGDFNPYLQAPTKISWLMPYQVEYLITEKITQTFSNDHVAEKVADIMGVGHDTVAQIHSNAIYLSGLTYAGRERAKGKIKSRLFTNLSATTTPFEDKFICRGDPQLPNFLAPPRSRVMRQYARRFFDALIQWHDAEPDLATISISEFLHATQRTHSRVRHRHPQYKKRHLALLRAIGVSSRVRIEVRVREDHPVSDSELKTHYSADLGVPQKHVLVHRVEEREGRYDGAFGYWQINVVPTDDFYAKRDGEQGATNRFWDALRFACFSAGVYLIPTGFFDRNKAD